MTSSRTEELERQLDWAKGEVDGLKSVVAALTKERDELGATLASVSDALETVRKAAHAPKDVTIAEAVTKLRLERDEALAKAESYRKQGEADWNACCDVLVWARSFPKDSPPPSRAVAAVCRRLTELDPTLSDRKGWFPESAEPVSPAYTFTPNPEMMPTAHAEKVLVAVAKAAAQVGAEDMREKVIALTKREEQLAREQSEKESAAKYGRFDYWDGRRSLARQLAKWFGDIKAEVES